MADLTFERFVEAPPATVWQVVSDLEGYGDIAPNLSKVMIEEGEGLGLRRRCWDTNGGTWVESCTLWDDGRAYSMEVDTSDYPYPFKKMVGTWSCQPQDNGTLIQMRFDYQLKYGLVGKLLGRTLEKRFEPICEALLDNWAQKIQEIPKEE